MARYLIERTFTVAIEEMPSDRPEIERTHPAARSQRSPGSTAT